jgi:hypothetical protein
MNDVRDQVIAFITSAVVGVGVFLLTNTFAKDPSSSIALAIVSGIGTHLIFDRVAYRRKIEDATIKIIQTLRVGTPFEAGFRIFRSEKEAVSYLNSILENVTVVWNTRLGGKSGSYSKVFFQSVDTFDDAVLRVAARGGDVRVIVETDSDDLDGDPFLAKIDKFTSGSASGVVEVYPVKFNCAPVLQIVIVENQEGMSEALIGWSVGEERSFTYQVCLFRDPPIVEYFKALFDEYTLYRTGSKDGS